jgi:hypothetical protein
MTDRGWAWSYVLSGVTCVGLWLAGSRGYRRAGWLVALANEVLWAIYAVSTGQHGFLLGAAVFGFIYARNVWRDWHG